MKTDKLSVRIAAIFTMWLEIAFQWQLCVMPERVSTVAIAQLAAYRKSWCVEVTERS
ncbi:hypothetical protein [Paraburkholderia sp. BL6665CI2N2]|uniref:hypothetical protein n=1 Tax=Paraburkholderia sp. BL6665CI2N2 TaxID=1938806 RepID=UPI001416F5F2|nr:hypothetical protein [Paraburkholderia sp. BL6665CI2N2]